MKTLIVEDEFANRVILQQMLSPYGEIHVAVNGKEALAAVKRAENSGISYDLVCLDIMMPEVDGQAVLRGIRTIEKKRGLHQKKRAKIVMTTALSDKESVVNAIAGECDAYVLKPYDKKTLLATLRKLGLPIKP